MNTVRMRRVNIPEVALVPVVLLSGCGIVKDDDNAFCNGRLFCTSKIVDSNFGTIYQININSQIKNIILLADGFPVNFFVQDKRSLTDEMIDMVYLEMCHLIQLIINEIAILSPKLYLLGKDEVLDDYIDEEKIASMWLSHKSKCFVSKKDVWKYFECHPSEKYLKSNSIEYFEN